DDTHRTPTAGEVLLPSQILAGLDMPPALGLRAAQVFPTVPQTVQWSKPWTLFSPRYPGSPVLNTDAPAPGCSSRLPWWAWDSLSSWPAVSAPLPRTMPKPFPAAQTPGWPD